ncbi:MAG TPA: DUF3857 domain-containing protein [Acidisarcina sp.]
MNIRRSNYLTSSPLAARSLFFLLPLGLLCLHGPIAHASTWQAPTPAELSMTSAPDDPGAAGVYLFREEIGDDKLHFHSVYVRLKILTEDGKKYADVEMPIYEKAHYKIADIQGRTVHSDGTVIPYTGKPIDKLIVATREYQYHTRVFTLPDVQVGSILEYRYDLRYDDDFVYEPTWFIQQEIPVRAAHYKFVPYQRELQGPHGEITEGQTAYVPQLPAGAEIKYNQLSQIYELDMVNIPATPQEEFMPPMQSLSYRVQFYYTAFRKVEDYWKDEGKYWSKDVDKFASTSKKIQEAVQQIVLPGDTEQQKVAKVYDAMMPLENTSFTRERSTEENKAEGLKVKTAADIWEQKRGNDDEITLLFIAMVRAAGLKAYAMRLTSRDRTIFRPAFLSMSQLDDDVAIVLIDGKEQFFDPGQRYCAFGQMHWKHTLTQGLRQTEHGTEIAESPGLGYQQSTVLRSAELTLGPQGQVTGFIRINMAGEEALKWRQEALVSDVEAVKKKFQEELQSRLPSGVEARTNHFLGLADSKSALMAVVDVSGTLGTSTAKRVFLPSCFFEAGSKPLFSHEKRELPIDLLYPYQMKDTVVIKLPPTLVAESVPKNTQLPLVKRAIFGATYKVDAGVYTQSRLLLLATSFYDAKEYPELRDFYQKMNAQDQQQIILKVAPPAAASGGAQ